MKTLAKNHVSDHCVIGEKIFKNILTEPGKLPGLSRNGPCVFLIRKSNLKLRLNVLIFFCDWRLKN